MRHVSSRVLVLSSALACMTMSANEALCDDSDAPPSADSIRLSIDRVLHRLEDLRDDKTDTERTRERGKAAARAYKDLTDQLKAIGKYEHGERELKGEVGGGFAGDEAPIEGGRTSPSGVTEPVTTSNADPATNYKINSTVTLTRGTYPQRFRLVTSVGVLLSGKKFQEDVSNLLISYGHFTANSTEIYGFAERFSDSYLSIDQRWEVGGGAYLALRSGLTKAAARELVALCSDPRLEAQLDQDSRIRSRNGWGDMTEPCFPRKRGAALSPPNPLDRPQKEADWEDARRRERAARSGRAVAAPAPPTDPALFHTDGWDPVEHTVYPFVFRTAAGEFTPEQQKAAAEELYRLRQLRQSAIRSIQHQGARISVGVAVSLFAEVERSTINLLVDKESKRFAPLPAANTETKSITLDGAHAFRVTVRPTFRMRPSTHLYFESFAYLKQRVWPGRESKRIEVDVDLNEGVVRKVNDLRIDTHSEVRYILAGADTLGGEKFSVVGSYDFHYDAAPPFLPALLLREQGILGVSGDGLAARPKHHVFKIQLAVGWGG